MVSAQWIVTAHPRFARHALDEIGRRSLIVSAERVGQDAVLVETASGRCPLDEALRADPPTFVQHLAPIDLTVTMDGGRGDLDVLRRAAVLAVPAPGGAVAVDCRVGDRAARGGHLASAYTARDVEIATGTALADADVAIDVAQPRRVLHIYLAGQAAHFGLTEASQLSRLVADPLGRGRTVVRVSRAEQKLDEALALFDLSVHPGDRVLDLGAAPGGWSYLLAERGATVTAVDPAELHALVAKHPQVDHRRLRGEVMRWEELAFDLVVNDMSLDPADSASIMCAVAESVPPGTPAVMTIKLPTRNASRWEREARDVLASAWQVAASRHLPANRQELTWLLHRLPL
jgi:23S rRNA (cytidine2498-2'-O)-methyltransferase